MGLNPNKRKRSKKKYYKKHSEEIKKYTENYRQKRLKEWKTYFETNYGSKTNCQICNKLIGFFTGDSTTSVAWDHKNGKSELIKGSPVGWLQHHYPTPENIAIWESCKFGILCHQCNRRLMTFNRIHWLKKAIKYAESQ